MQKEYYITSLEKLMCIDDNSNVVFGHEGCIRRINDDEIIEYAELSNNKKCEMRFLTPIVPDKYIERTRNLICKLCEIDKVKVTFNDYGLLYSCFDLIKNDKIVPVLGRILTRSILDCPWSEKISCNENEEIKNAIMGSSLNHKSKLNFLKELLIHEIEINCYDQPVIAELKKIGFKVAVHSGNFLISTSRVCYAAYWEHNPIKDECCKYTCDKKIYIELIKKWSKIKNSFIEPNVYDYKYYSKLYVQGNQVFCKQETDDEIESLVDYLLLEI